MKISAKEITELRLKTNLPVMECKAALAEAEGDQKTALEILKRRSLAKVDKRSQREAKSGLVESYLHDGKIGVLVELLCETDFVAKNRDFKDFAHNLALQIAATDPKYIKKEDVSEENIAEGFKEYIDDAKKAGKPDDIAEKIAQGKVDKYLEKICLLEQPYIKDQDKKIVDLLNDLVAKIGENILISRFFRIELGKE